MMWPFSWGARFSRHLEHEITWLRSELRFQRDENQRLQNALVSFKFGGTVSTLAPAMPREVAQTTREAEDERYDDPVAVGTFAEEAVLRGAAI